jgi:exonuclease VII large subunit
MRGRRSKGCWLWQRADAVKLAGATAAAQAAKLGQLARVIHSRVQAQRREVEAARRAYAEREREREAQQALLDAADAKLEDCRKQIAEVRKRRFSPYDAPGHNAAQARLAKDRRKEAEALQLAQERAQIAWIALAEAKTTLRRMESRLDTIEDLRRRARKVAAVHREMLQEVAQDEDFAVRRA